VKAALEGALSSQNVDGLLGATGKRLKTGLSSVAFQIANDISPTISATVASTESTRARIVELPSILPNVAKTILSATESIAKETVGQIQGDIKDPSRIKQRVEEQQRALVRALSNENDLKGPRYEVLGETGSYEVRSYPSYTVVSTRPRGVLYQRPAVQRRRLQPARELHLRFEQREEGPGDDDAGGDHEGGRHEVLFGRGGGCQLPGAGRLGRCDAERGSGWRYGGGRGGLCGGEGKLVARKPHTAPPLLTSV